MKKNILKATLVATFALLAGYNVYNSQKAEGMSELALANVEALADGKDEGCHDTNGYTAFMGKSGGAYDCCSVWVAKAPNTSEGNCH